MMSIELESLAPKTTIFRYIIGFILIGLAWGFTTPFIRRAARTHQPTEHPILNSLSVKNSWLRSRLYGAFFGILDILKSPQYAIPLAINLTGSIWFFLLIGKADMSLTVPITNSFSFLFTVAGDWYLDRKVISKGAIYNPIKLFVIEISSSLMLDEDTWIGMSLTLGGIVLCVQSKNNGPLID